MISCQKEDRELLGWGEVVVVGGRRGEEQFFFSFFKFYIMRLLHYFYNLKKIQGGKCVQTKPMAE